METRTGRFIGYQAMSDDKDRALTWPQETFLPPDIAKAFSLESKVDLVLSQLAYINRAFPDGVDSHRKAHEAMMLAAQAEENFWRELRLDIAKKGAFALLITLFGLAAVGLSVKFGLASIAAASISGAAK
jgi:hypothetical protein